MAKTTAERVQAFRQRQAALISELTAANVALEAALHAAEALGAGEVQAWQRKLDAALAREASLAEENDRLRAESASGPVPRCPDCRTELACPRCYRERAGYD